MPKKKDKKSGDKQDQNKKTPKKDSVADKSGSTDKEKDLYLTQMRYLNEELERYQLKCGELQRQNKDLICQYSELEKDKKDVVEYLKRSLLETEDEVKELSEQLESRRQAAGEDRDALQRQLSQLRLQLQGRIDELAKEKMTLAEKLSRLEEFQKEKETLMSNMESLEEQLTCQKEAHKDDIHSLEMKALLEKRRLEKELESHVAAMAAEVQHLVDQKVPETTRLALEENAEVKARFSHLSEKTDVLWKENAALRDRKSQLKVDVDILEETLSKTSRTSCIRKRVVEQLTEKCQQLQAEQTDWRQQLERLQSKHTGVLAEREALREERDSLSEQCSKTTAEVGRLEVELREERRRRMKSIVQDAGVTLRQALMEVSTEQDLELDSVLQWKQLMPKLLAVLDRGTLAGSTAVSGQLKELHTSDAAAAQTVTPDPDASFQLQRADGRPGDLGSAPQTKPKHKDTRSGTGTTSSSTHVSLHRKPSNQKTDSSVNLTDAAV
ncbi:cilia- and flagella-associated protein 157-like [Embiotoca jacksoni]|uniref:cilia- and flagella-associated protein 157-like n=1 Tax=Embiotoca jacksoni TaxID=100190 RepID=UPI003704A00D